MLRYVVLAASAAVNVTLAVLLVRMPQGVRAEATTPAPQMAMVESQPAQPIPPAESPPAQRANPGDVLAGFEDVARILEAMRAEGLSPEIRYMAGSMIVLQRLFAEKRRILFGELRYTWQYGVSGGNLPREKMAAGREHTLKRDDIMLALMGDDYLIGRFPDAMVSSPRFGGLPLEKIRQVLLIESDYSAAKALTLGQGTMDSARAAEVRLAGDKDADIRAILTPEEYERYQAATSPAMHLLRRGLAGADVDDAQFAAIGRRARAADPLGTGSSNETLAPFVEIILAEAGPTAALTYARNTDRSQPSALVVLESAGLEAGEVARRYLVLQAYRTPPQDTSRAAADYEAVTAGLSDEQRTALERSSAGSRLKRAANAKRRTP